MPIRRFALAALLAAALAPAAEAHHGIIFTADEQIRITGKIVKELTGNPHYEIRVQEGDRRWTVDLGNAFRLKKGGLDRYGRDMPIGTTVTIQGFPAVDQSLSVMDARVIWIGGEEHRLFDEGEPKY